MEIELKFQIPAPRRAALKAALTRASTASTRLRAIYFDTPDCALAAAGLALRLRNEGGHWVQTLKGRGDGVLARLEHEVPLGPGATPTLDIARHADHAAGVALARALRGKGALEERFRTDIRRTQRRVRSGGAVIEIALDEGRLQAGTARLPVHEIEFELISGPPTALVALAARWAARHGLWWDVRTKAERGERLARALERVPATKSAPPPIDPAAAPARAWAAMVQSCLTQVLPNAAEVAEGLGSAEHLHQLRVGLRRLRTALRDFADWSADPAAAQALEAAWREPFARLGAARDLDVLLQTLWPRLQAAGGPPPPAFERPANHAAPRAEVSAPAFQGLLLETLRLTVATAAGEDAVELRPAAARALRRAWRRALGEAERFDQLAVADQHRVRKRLKRLRYGFDFLSALYPSGATRRLEKRLGSAGDALGDLNDLAIAQATCDPVRHAWALGWLAAEQTRAVTRAHKQLLALAAARQPWRADR